MSRVRVRSILTVLLAAGLYFAVALILCHLRGVTTSGFGAHQDEPAHLVTGLMVHDWLATAAFSHPIRFAEQFYIHYPKVGIGQWPPVFYGVQGVWTLVFGATSMSFVLLMIALSASIATAVFVALRALCGSLGAFVAGLLFLALPLVQISTGRVMAEIPLALFTLLAALQFGRFLDEGRLRNSLGFGFFAVLAILTKGNGIALALLPGIAIVIGGRWDLLRRPALWAAALPVVLLCAPWYALTLQISAGTWAGGSSPSVSYALNATVFYLATTVALGGVVFAIAALTGLVSALRSPGAKGPWIALGALLPSLFLVHIVIPSSIDDRHWVLFAPAWAAFAVLGARAIGARLHATRGPAVAVVLLALAFALESFELPRKDQHGFRAAARIVLDDPSLADSVLMISSDSIGEGQFVAEVALGEERLGHIVLRASKMLCDSDWLGTSYEGFYTEPEELEDYLRSIPVGLLALDRSWQEREPLPYHRLLERMVAADPNRWRLVAVVDIVRDGVDYPGALELYLQVGHEQLPRLTLELAQILRR